MQLWQLLNKAEFLHHDDRGHSEPKHYAILKWLTGIYRALPDTTTVYLMHPSSFTVALMTAPCLVGQTYMYARHIFMHAHNMPVP